MKYASPNQLEDALGLLATGQWSILAGGTDYYPSLRDSPSADDILDLWQIQELKAICPGTHDLRIGALVTWTDIVKADLPAALDGLKGSAREIGSIQIQNRATVVGNICNASPAADGVPPLLTLNAEIELASVHGTRRLPLGSFLQGSRQTDKRTDELVTAILIPNASLRGVSGFRKLGFRKYLVISVSMLAARLEIDSNHRIQAAYVSVGSCSAVAQRLGKLEAALLGASSARPLSRLVLPEHLSTLTPIDDVRAGKAYRLSATLALAQQMLDELGSKRI